ncbi:GHKL domain-containing protein [Dyadobacter sp. SG02]|uniref:sensor histidine kinase n=1 Tax=Dyadobacter sp. SG02 TaxID=1855291 RepID=UPI0008CCE25F|nr:histidine kinase [Dyadobacter sp. SG02]SEJ52709.1 GHKL domain-containing protein [Dyadobacter sp. SG02]
MTELKSFSGSQPDKNVVDEAIKEPFWGLFNLKGKRRVEYHFAFWACFVAYHLMYFLPAFSSQQLDDNLQVSYTVYYLRFVPVFYFSLLLFTKLQRRFKGIPLLVMMLLILLGTMHIVTLSMYVVLDNIYTLRQLSPAFETVGGFYLKPPATRQGWEWFIFFYDVQELQLLILPVGLKMVQFGLRQQMAQAEFERETLRTELTILKSELEPHFVYNVINSAYAKVLPASRAAAGYLDKLSQMLKYTLYETGGDWVPLRAEIRSLKRYMQLERIRHGRRLTVTWHQQGKASVKHKVPTLLMVTLGENAVKHGIRSHAGKSTVRVDIQVSSDSLQFTIENDKAPASGGAKKTSSHGLGLKNIQRRLALLYPKRHHVEIKESENSYSVTLWIPLAD